MKWVWSLLALVALAVGGWKGHQAFLDYSEKRNVVADLRATAKIIDTYSRIVTGSRQMSLMAISQQASLDVAKIDDAKMKVEKLTEAMREPNALLMAIADAYQGHAKSLVSVVPAHGFAMIKYRGALELKEGAVADVERSRFDAGSMSARFHQETLVQRERELRQAEVNVAATFISIDFAIRGLNEEVSELVKLGIAEDALHDVKALERAGQAFEGRDVQAKIQKLVDEKKKAEQSKP